MAILQEKIDKVSKISGDIMSIGFVSLLFIFFLLLIARTILGKFGIDVYAWEYYSTAKHIYFTFNWIVAGISVLAFFIHAIFSHWATDEEKEQRKNEIKEAVREMAEEEPVSPSILPVQEIYDPFADTVSDEQKKAIKQLLHDLPSHKERKEEINMSIVSRYLTALVELGFISQTKSADLNGLRNWVESATGKQAPEQFRFNDAFPSTYKPGIKKAKDNIKQVLKI